MSTDAHGHGHDAYAPADEWEPGPAKVKTLARRYEGELAKRFRRVKGLIRTTVAENDALRLGQAYQDALAAPVRDFRFEDNAQKEQAFMQWYRGAAEDEVLEPVGTQRLREGDHYTAKYVRSGYHRGMRHADRELRDAGVPADSTAIQTSFNAPIHTEQARLLYRRQFTALEGITQATGKEISRTLTDGLVAGENPRTIAGTLNGRVDAVGITRARTMARTELSRSYNTAAATRYQEHGISKVEVLVHEPCSVCQAIAADDPYPVDQARGILPGHPNCVCSLSPVVT